MEKGLLQLKGRTALITGAGQGVGRETALQFARHGISALLVNDFYANRAQATADEIARIDDSIQVETMVCDIGDFYAVGAGIETFVRKHGRLDILVNNAGNAGPTGDLSRLTPFTESEPQEWAQWLGTNLYGVLNCTRHALPLMIQNKYGRIITVISDAGRVGEPHLAVYSAAKAGAAGFMRAIAKLGGRHGVTANSVALGGVNTPAVRDMVHDETAMKKALSHYVIRRFGEPIDAAAMILFLSSEVAGWITGQTYPVNGGYSFAL